MARLMMLALCVSVSALLAVPAAAPPQPEKLTEEEKRTLEKRWEALKVIGDKAYGEGKRAEAAKAWEEALAVARRLYPRTEFPEGHPKLATSVNNLASLYKAQGKLRAAEPLYKEGLALSK